MKKLNILVLSLLFCYSLGIAKELKQFNESELQLHKRGNLTFIENKGQWDNDVRYLTRTEGLNAWITSSGVVYDFFTLIEGVEDGQIDPQMKNDPNIDPFILNNSIKGHVVNMRFLNNSQAEFFGNGIKATYYNYYIGNDPNKWTSKVPLFSDISVSNIYNGIDARYYYEKSGLRYDLIVNPKASPSQIQIQFEGAEALNVDSKGDLVISTSIGDISQCKLYAYQEVDGEKHQVGCSFKLEKNNVVSFNIGDYDENLPLIIDPLIYSTYLGGSDFDAAYNCRIDEEGNFLIAGGTMSANFPLTPGAYQTAIGASIDCIVVKMNYSGSELLYSTFFGANSYDTANGIDYDAQGNIYITGYVQSTNFPVTANVFQPNHGGGTMDAFATKFNAEGTELLYSTHFGGNGYDAGNMLIVDENNNCFIGGFAASTNFPTSSGIGGGVVQSTYGGGTYDGFVVKINPNASSVLRCTYIGGAGNDTQQGLALDKDGYIYTCGWTDHESFPTTENAYQEAFGGVKDGTLCKLTPDMTEFVYSTFIGGSNDDQLRYVVVDTNKYVYLAGSTNSANYPVTAGAFQTVFGGGTSNDGIVTKFDSSGTSLVYSTFIGGPLAENTRCIAVSEDGSKAFATGSTSWADFPVTPDGQQTEIAGSTDAFLIMLNADGSNLDYSTFVGGSLADGGGVIDYDGQGNVIMTGSTVSIDFPVTDDCYQSYFAGGSYDIFVAKYELNPALASPLLSYPPNRSIFINTEPMLEWKSVETAVSYDLQVSTISNFSTTIINVTELSDTTYQIPAPLNETTKYYWHVRSRDSEGNESSWSMAWNFATEGPVAAPILISPSDASEDQMLKFICSWHSTLLASSYHLQISTNEDFSANIYDVEQADTTFQVENLIINTTYYWRVRAFNEFASSPWSELWSFETGNFVYVGTGSAYQTSTTGFTTPSPYSNYYQHGRIQLIFRASELIESGAFPGNIKGLAWNVALLGTVGPLLEGQYTIKMKLTDAELINAWDYEGWTTVWEPDSAFTAKLGWNMHAFTEPFYWDGVSNIRLETCYNHPGIVSNYQNPSVFYTPTNYNSTGYRTNSTDSPDLCDMPEPYAPIVGVNRANTLFNFELLPLMPPMPLQPEKNALGVSVAPFFDWTDVENADNYQLQIADNLYFEPIVFDDEGIAESEYQLDVTISLEETTQYYWRVRAFDNEGGYSYWSYRWEFITEGPIDAPELISPVNELDIAPTKLIFNWYEVFAATGYNIQISKLEDFSEIAINEDIDFTTYLNTSDLEFSTTYYWRVMANNLFVNSEWSEVWQFTTGNFATFGEDETYYLSGSNPPGPYGNVWGGVHNQVLITREELIEAGVLPGEINALMLNVYDVNGCAPLQDFTINMKHSYANELDNWEFGGFTDVYFNSAYVPVKGWNLHAFTTPFEWDGGSSILIDLCFNNMTYSQNASVYYSTTPVVRNISFWNDTDPNVCTSPAITGVLNSRPNIKLSMEYQDFKPPMLVYPDYMQLGVPQLPNFQWAPVEGAVSYELVLSLADDFSIPEFAYSEIAETNYQATGADLLDLTTIYYWRVRAYDENNNPSNWSYKYCFITEGPLETPIQTLPLNSAAEVSTVPLFEWLEVLGSTYYRLMCSTSPDFSENILIDNVVSTNSLTGIGIPLLAEYYWKVQAGNPFTESNWSEVWSFTTSSNVTLGTGTTTNLYYNWPAPYGNYYQAAKHQILYKASEIINNGGLPGNLTGLAFNVANVNTCGPLRDYTIKIKQTSANEVNTTWDLTGFTTVFYEESYQPSGGWNAHNFATTFDWDGVSNVLVDICFNNTPTAATQNASTYYTPTSYNSVRYYYANNNADFCSSPTSALTVANRPNTMFLFDNFSELLFTPTLLNPEFAATDVSLTPELTWIAVLDADSYTVQLSNNADFTSFIADTVVTTTNYTTPQLTIGTTYYWRVKAQNNEGNFSLFSPVRYFTTFSPPPLGQVTLVQPQNGLVNAQVERLPMSWNSVANANSYTFQINDEEDFTDVLLSQDFTVTSLLVSGFDYSTTYYWRVMAKNSEGSVGPWSEVWSFTTAAELFEQEINLVAGWNIISSYVNPVEANMYDVFEDIETSVNIVKNSAGQIFAPQQEINNIGDWNFEDGYLVNTSDNVALALIGDIIVPENTPMFIESGWNIIPYLRTAALSPATALATLESSLVLAKNNLGGIYFPGWGINTLGNLQPGQGYYVYLSELGILIYPANSGTRQIAEENITPSARFLVPIYKNTGNNATLLLQFDGIENGAEVGVYNVNDELIGSAAVHNGVAAVTIWGDDEITKQVDGAMHSELLSVKLLNSNVLQNVSLYSIKEITKDIEQDNLIYATNAIYLAKATVINNDELIFSIGCVPNPAANSTTFEFSLADDGNAEIVVYSLRGDEVAKLRLDGYSAGMHRVVFNTDDLANGSYNVVLRSGTNYTSTIMMIVK